MNRTGGALSASSPLRLFTPVNVTPQTPGTLPSLSQAYSFGSGVFGAAGERS